ncbi:MAG: hypothetical protein PHI31_09685 [Desulfuromonadaceae bacterium]|nr:hypothetical protein [Desulfuromonadaceae bacterium]
MTFDEWWDEEGNNALVLSRKEFIFSVGTLQSWGYGCAARHSRGNKSTITTSMTRDQRETVSMRWLWRIGNHIEREEYCGKIQSMGM